MTEAADFDRKPKPPILEVDLDIEGSEGVLEVHIETTEVDGLRIGIEGVHGKISLTEQELIDVSAAIDRFKVALHALKGTQP